MLLLAIKLRGKTPKLVSVISFRKYFGSYSIRNQPMQGMSHGKIIASSAAEKLRKCLYFSVRAYIEEGND